ncbi:hypothetical protein BDK51DRAFT_41408 [Blyttiomyces helicus]|uniref:Uncharacterized protein n=1 Tax=Blyttiomyces helicus TaxID=388810 RepID=A0A4P9WIX7_9FUNG|nr:hypothetical protein BDK51DRAFT_41408 [Blyttiomyces helicus]|eukprot:RKO92312.1 hypothetical protein BDK51DRAFT_41408 [Blyttiomyces helicus]
MSGPTALSGIGGESHSAGGSVPSALSTRPQCCIDSGLHPLLLHLSGDQHSLVLAVHWCALPSTVEIRIPRLVPGERGVSDDAVELSEAHAESQVLAQRQWTQAKGGPSSQAVSSRLLLCHGALFASFGEVISGHVLFPLVLAVVGCGVSFDVVFENPHVLQVRIAGPLGEELPTVIAVLAILAKVLDSKDAINVVLRHALVDDRCHESQGVCMAVKGVVVKVEQLQDDNLGERSDLAVAAGGGGGGGPDATGAFEVRDQHLLDTLDVAFALAVSLMVAISGDGDSDVSGGSGGLPEVGSDFDIAIGEDHGASHPGVDLQEEKLRKGLGWPLPDGDIEAFGKVKEAVIADVMLAEEGRRMCHMDVVL